MDIPNNFKQKNNQGNIKKTSDIESVISLSHLGESIDIDPKTISEACAKAAKEAYHLGETNDEESYREDMEEVLTQILKEKAKKKR
ncbi:MAG: hypothetical protein VW397_02860 [Candidatus Margulisiibacteriota bacterium]